MFQLLSRGDWWFVLTHWWCLLMQALDWGGVVLYGLLSVLNLIWFKRIIELIRKKVRASKLSAAAAPSSVKSSPKALARIALGEEDQEEEDRIQAEHAIKQQAQVQPVWRNWSLRGRKKCLV
jgi:hypothetical protein